MNAHRRLGFVVHINDNPQPAYVPPRAPLSDDRFRGLPLLWRLGVVLVLSWFAVVGFVQTVVAVVGCVL